MNDFSEGSPGDAYEREEARQSDLAEFLEAIGSKMGEKVTPVDPPRICLGSELVGESENDFLLWRWKGPRNFTYAKVPKPRLPELIARERSIQMEKKDMEEKAPGHELFERELAGMDAETRIREIVYSARDTFGQPFIFVTCPKLFNEMEIVGASEEYAVAWKETDGKVSLFAIRWEDLGEGYELVEIPVPFAPSRISKGIGFIKSKIGKLFGHT